jgi:phage I-like protein
MRDNFLNAIGDFTELASVAIDFGIQSIVAQGENEKMTELLQQLAELDAQSADKLKKLLSESITDKAKTQVMFDFLNADKIKKLETERKKKLIIPYIGLGVGVVLLGLIFYKLHKQNG